MTNTPQNQKPQARLLEACAIALGQKNDFIYEITDDVIQNFCALSGDYNPLHSNYQYAHDAGFSGPVVHGAFQQALVSQAVGMWLIGVKCIISSLATDFLRPLIYPVKVKVASEVIQWSPKSAIGVVRTRVFDEHGLICYSESTVKVGLHLGSTAQTEAAPSPQTAPINANNKSQRKVLLLLGASGGIGQQIAAALSTEYDLIAVGRRISVLENLKSSLANTGAFDIIDTDLLVNPDALANDVSQVLKGRPLWGVIQASAIPLSEENLESWQKNEFEAEMTMSGYLTLVLARILKAHAGSQGGRLVFFGSNGALHQHPSTTHLRYAIGKSMVSVMAKGLAGELAKNKITVNVISPDFLPIGMNASVNPRYAAMKAAANPMKRNCDVADVLQQLNYFLDEKSQFVSGQEVVLSGGLL